MKIENAICGLIVHHDQLGIGKISSVDSDTETIEVIFLFYAPVVKLNPDTLTVVGGSTVNVIYGDGYNQNFTSLYNKGQQIFPPLTKPFWFNSASLAGE